MHDKVFRGQIDLWLVSIFGSAVAVAQIGALGRLAMVLGFFHIMFGTLIAPRFARLNSEKKKLVRRFLAVQLLLWCIAFLLVALVALFPSQILWILGSNYADLQTEVILLATISGLGIVQGGMHTLNVSRGFILDPRIFIPLNIVIVVIAYSIFPPVDARAALSAGVIGTAFAPIIQNYNFFSHIRWQK